MGRIAEATVSLSQMLIGVLEEFLDALDLRDVTLCGVSIGGLCKHQRAGVPDLGQQGLVQIQRARA